MSTLLDKYLRSWEKPYIQDQDLQAIFAREDTKRYDAVKYALKKGHLFKIKRGLYLINPSYQKQNYDPFEIAQIIYGPSYISLESALSFHGWIPETVYTTTSVAIRRSKEFRTPIGYFNFSHTPTQYFYNEVSRIESGSVFFIAEPWKALADCIYVYKKKWNSVRDISLDLRIEPETFEQSNIVSLKKITTHYDSKRVRIVLGNFLRELTK